MATNPEKAEKKERNETPMGTGGRHTESNLSDGLNDFIQRNRKSLGILLVIVLVIAAGFIAGLSIRDVLQKQSLKSVEALNRRYTALKYELTTAALESEVNALLDDIVRFADKNSGYAASRAYSISAEIYAGRGNWAAAEASWKSAAKAGAKTYLAPVSLFNAATAAEEQGNTAAAIELYAESIARREAFPAAPRAQFSIGRLREAEGNIPAALEAYNELINRWNSDPVWPNLAQSRIIALTVGIAR